MIYLLLIRSSGLVLDSFAERGRSSVPIRILVESRARPPKPPILATQNARILANATFLGASRHRAAVRSYCGICTEKRGGSGFSALVARSAFPVYSRAAVMRSRRGRDLRLVEKTETVLQTKWEAGS